MADTFPSIIAEFEIHHLSLAESDEILNFINIWSILHLFTYAFTLLFIDDLLNARRLLAKNRNFRITSGSKSYFGSEPYGGPSLLG